MRRRSKVEIAIDSLVSNPIRGQVTVTLPLPNADSPASLQSLRDEWQRYADRVSKGNVEVQCTVHRSRLCVWLFVPVEITFKSLDVPEESEDPRVTVEPLSDEEADTLYQDLDSSSFGPLPVPDASLLWDIVPPAKPSSHCTPIPSIKETRIYCFNCWSPTMYLHTYKRGGGK